MLAFEETPKKNNKIINVDDSGAEKRVKVEDKKVINDKIIVSKGHAAATLYPILADFGIIEKLETISFS